MNTRPQSRPEAELPELVVTDTMVRAFVDALGAPYCFDAPPPGVIRAALQAAYGQQCAATRPSAEPPVAWINADKLERLKNGWPTTVYGPPWMEQARPELADAVPLYTRPAEVGGDRYSAIRNASSRLQIYVYDDPADPLSGEWMYKPNPENVDAFCDALMAESTPTPGSEAGS